MNLQRIRKQIEEVDRLYTVSGYTAFTREHIIGIVIACNVHYGTDPYNDIFKLGVTTEIIDYACKYSMFLICCNIYNKDKNHIIHTVKMYLNCFNYD